MPDLDADRRRQGSKSEVERRELDLDAAFLLLIRESLTDSVRGEISRVGQSDLVMLIVGAADPKSDGVDERTLRAVLALAHHLGLFRRDSGLVILSVSARNMIHRIVFRE